MILAGELCFGFFFYFSQPIPGRFCLGMWIFDTCEGTAEGNAISETLIVCWEVFLRWSPNRVDMAAV